MKTRVHIDDCKFHINNEPTYAGRVCNGRAVEGLLFNSRMIQAVFDDENPRTRDRWRYPDTGEWDADRNTREFCSALPVYRRHGLLGVTVGLQGGGSIYSPEVYDQYICSAYEPDGTFRPPYFERLARILKAADDCGMVVIVNYFYFKQAKKLENSRVIEKLTEAVTDWLLRTGYTNILVDVMNEVNERWGIPLLAPENAHRLIDIVQQTTLDGRRLLAGTSTCGGQALPTGRWAELEDFSMPHGNGCTPEELTKKLRRFKSSEPYKKRPRPILINEDSVFIENLNAAFEAGASWGFYCQGYGSDYRDRFDWKQRQRENSYDELSGFQTVPVNWSLNTERKQAFFSRVAEITGADER